MRSVRICLVLFALLISVRAQSIGEWKIFSDMKKINSTVITTTGIWAATEGAAFKLNFSDSSYSTITKANGLNSQALTAIAVDNYNKVWLGSREGYINIFNPADNSLFKIEDIAQSNKTLKQINNIFVKGDSVFVSYDFGLSIINAKSFTFIDSFLKLGSFPAESRVINSFKLSSIYALTEYGVAIQKSGATNLSAPESWNTFTLSSFLPPNSAQSANNLVEFSGQLLLSTSDGIYKFSNNSWQPFTLPGIKILDMKVTGTSLYAISTSQLFRYSNGQVTTLLTNANTSFSSLSVAADQTVYISTAQGLLEFKNSRSRYLFPNGPAGNLFVNLSIDPAGNLWVATGKNLAGKGFFKFDGNNWTQFNKASYPILPSNDFYNVFAAPDSAVYLSNWGGGVTVFKNNNFQVYNASNSTLIGIPNDVNFIAVPDAKTDSKGNLWILNAQSASRKPLSVLQKNKPWVNFSFSNPSLTENDNLDKLVIDQFDTKWFTVAIKGRFGLYYFNESNTMDNLTDDTQGFLNTSNNLLSDLINALAVDQRGYLWIGTNVGLNVILDPSKPKVTSNLGIALRNQNITCIAIDPLDQKWIGTQQGVFVLSSDGIVLINQYNTKNSPLPSDDIKSITFDPKNGIVYIGTDFGLASLQTSSIQPPQSFSEISVYPNPFVLGADAAKVTIDGLIKNSSIRIFSINGNLIRDFKSPGGKIAFWDGKDFSGNYVSTGIYIIVAYDEEANNVKTSKIAVIKK